MKTQFVQPTKTPRKLGLLLAITYAATVALLPSVACADTWAERLGFPAEKTVILLHAHEMGICHATNAAAKKLHASDSKHSSSVTVPGPWFLDFAAWSREHPDADVGLSLTINSELTNHRWQPVSPHSRVTSLVDSEGYFWPSTTQTMVNAEVDEVEQELHSQIQRALRAGLKPTHLTTHLGTLFMRLDFTEVYLRLARQYWIPAVVIELTPEHVERFQRLGYPIPEELIGLLENYPLPKVDDLQFVRPAESYEALRSSFVEMIHGLPPGLIQVSFHPAIESDELKRVTPDWQQRVWAAKLLQDPKIRTLLTSEKTILTNWREVMERYTGQAPAQAPTP
ncbi:MAG: ChbG/HpnK family deacetylase [Planctomycetes bacterium]|nr:ChbG/HpnK family deacetylase [Planctomycetota bacterium]